MVRVPHWRWLVFSGLSAISLVLVRVAAQPVARTPIDQDLPLIALLVGGWAWATRDTVWSRTIEMAVPLLAIALLTLVAHDRLRLAAFGIIAASALATAAVHARHHLGERCALVLGGVILLRWLPLASVEFLRESIVLAGTTLVYFVLGSSDKENERAPLILAAALAVGLATPIHPGRAMVFPFVLALLLFLIRSRSLAALLSAAAFVAAYAGRSAKGPLFVTAGIALLVLVLLPRSRKREVSSRALAPLRLVLLATAFALLTLWPWSGVIARALPLVPRYEAAEEEQVVLGYALAASESATIDVPPRVRHLVVTASGANAARMRPGRVLGTIEVAGDAAPCRRSIRIGDASDFGFDRSTQFFSSRNSYPRASAWDLRGYGMQAWIHGAGRVALGCGREIASLRVTAAADLPPDARLQIESIGIPRR